MKTWADMKKEELEAKGRENWDIDDYEAWCYIEEAQAEDDRDAEYLSHWSLY